ncbi:hypothetical protein E2C01_083603 [Portunus trituberculatus]|uniref:Uncharacterized protein n=1 Tax=Portunus trituberculatus TaxID=210409 RepID=A0A5B7J8G4_PORTR|nr:hypothetical protein [Portunus trituberculatus]
MEQHVIGTLKGTGRETQETSVEQDQRTGGVSSWPGGGALLEGIGQRNPSDVHVTRATRQPHSVITRAHLALPHLASASPSASPVLPLCHSPTSAMTKTP